MKSEFDQQVDLFFGQPFHPLNTVNWEVGHSETLEFLTRLFEAPDFLLARYDKPSIKHGLGLLVRGSRSGVMFAIKAEEVPWPKRHRCLAAMRPVFQHLMAPVFGDELVWVTEGFQPCFRWWDSLPLLTEGEPWENEFNQTLSSVLVSGLELESDACVQSCLRGIQWWDDQLPISVQDGIDHWRGFGEKRASSALRTWVQGLEEEVAT